MVRILPHHLAKSLVAALHHNRVDRAHRRCGGGNVAHQFAEHAGILRALPGEEKRDPRAAGGQLPVEATLLFEHRLSVGVGELLGSHLQLSREHFRIAGDDRDARMILGREPCGGRGRARRRTIRECLLKLRIELGGRCRAQSIDLPIQCLSRGGDRSRRNRRRRDDRFLFRGRRGSSFAEGHLFATFQKDVIRQTFAE